MSVLSKWTRRRRAAPSPGYRPSGHGTNRHERRSSPRWAPAALAAALLLACEGAPRRSEPVELVPLAPATEITRPAPGLDRSPFTQQDGSGAEAGEQPAGRPTGTVAPTAPATTRSFRKPPAPVPAPEPAQPAALVPAPHAASSRAARAPLDAGTEPGLLAAPVGDLPVAAFPAAPRTVDQREALLHVRVGAPGTVYRPREHLTFGVPFIEGGVTDTLELKAWRAADAVPVPLQARSLSSWPDGSVRWAVIDIQTELQAHGESVIVLGRADDIEPTPDAWTLDRGRKNVLGLKDGYTTWDVWSRGSRGDAVAGLRGTLTDRFEHEYDVELDTDSVEFLEWGPLRVTVRVRGVHRSVDGEGLPIDFHSVTVYAHFLAGIGQAHVEWSLENGPLEDPPGALAFVDYSLEIDAPQGERVIEPGGAYQSIDVRVDLRHTAEGASFVVGGRKVAPPDPTADLWLGVVTRDRDLYVHRVESAGNHPASLSIEPRGPLRIGLLPRTPETLFFLDDAQRKTFRLDLVRDAGPDGRERMARVTRPAYVNLNPIEVLATEAWGDTGVFYLPEAVDLSQPAGSSQGAPTGWADWGEALANNTHQSGSPRNQLSVFLTAMQSGRVESFRWARTRAWHAMDMRPYHIQGFLASEHPKANLYEGRPHNNEQASNRLGRSEMAQRFPEYKQELPSSGHGYNGFDPEHMTLDDVYECYLLTGSWLALDALRSAGEAMLTWKEVEPGGWIHSSRTFGWTLRALVQVYRATGEQRYLDAARDYVGRADAERGKGKVKYLRRKKPDPRHLDEPYDSPFMVAVALYGLAAYYDETGDERVPPMAADLVEFCMDAYRDGGFLPDLPTDRRTDGEGIVTSALGVSTWIPGAIAAGAFITGDHEPVDRILPYYAILKAHTSKPVTFGSRDWHWWQLYLASLQRRHGALAVQNPALYLERSSR